MADPVDANTFRAMMRRVPSPVVVVTAQGASEARGITIGSLSSVSLHPPLVGFNVGRETQMLDVMGQCSEFAVHILGENQAAVAEHFALSGLTGSEQFADVSHSRTAAGTPLLDGGSGILLCEPSDSLAAGDHVIFTGLVVDTRNRAKRGAVVYHEGAYRGVGDELLSRFPELVNRSSSDSS